MLNRLRDRREGGFTLIELLIVIVILGILATIVVFAVSGIRDRGNKSACKADYKTLETAAEAYYAQYGGYTSEDNLKTIGLLKSTSSKYNVDAATGAITNESSDCAGITPGTA